MKRIQVQGQRRINVHLYTPCDAVCESLFSLSLSSVRVSSLSLSLSLSLAVSFFLSLSHSLNYRLAIGRSLFWMRESRKDIHIQKKEADADDE